MNIRHFRLSKRLSYILRHNPSEYALELDDEGYVPLDELCEKCGFSINDIVEMVKAQTKKRFEIIDNKIRALYGHTVKQIKYPECEPPEFLYHGTSQKAANSILKDGLQPMQRQYVHLSQNEENAYLIGRRHDYQPVIVVINAKKAFQDEIKFYKAGDLFLTESIPAEYIDIKEKADDGLQMTDNG